MKKIMILVTFLGVYQAQAASKNDESLKQLFANLPSMQEQRMTMVVEKGMGQVQAKGFLIHSSPVSPDFHAFRGYLAGYSGNPKYYGKELAQRFIEGKQANKDLADLFNEYEKIVRARHKILQSMPVDTKDGEVAREVYARFVEELDKQ